MDALPESKLIPVLMDGVNMIKLVFFKELKKHLTKKYPDQPADYISKLSGAVLNDLFDTPNHAESHASFVSDNQGKIQVEMASLSKDFNKLRIPLTDALRVQFLCDSLASVDREAMLARAKALDVLIADRPVPLPKFFMELSRKLGVAYGILKETDDDPTV